MPLLLLILLISLYSSKDRPLLFRVGEAKKRSLPTGTPIRDFVRRQSIEIRVSSPADPPCPVINNAMRAKLKKKRIFYFSLFKIRLHHDTAVAGNTGP